jgi:hypothetical protein
MRVKISESEIDETSWVIFVGGELGKGFVLGVDLGSLLGKKDRFWLYDPRQEWVLIHDSENYTVDKLK